MAKKNVRYAICPCCSASVPPADMKICLGIRDRIELKSYGKRYDSYPVFLEQRFEWACDQCLRLKKAVLAKPELQNYSWYPHLAYCDTTKPCQSCGDTFVFAKAEKRHWYEKLNFWVESTAVRCLKCRVSTRKAKLESKTLSEILKKEEIDLTIPELETIIHIYQQWDKLLKVKYYQSILRKKLKQS